VGTNQKALPGSNQLGGTGKLDIKRHARNRSGS
jgi:hypothetical protein